MRITIETDDGSNLAVSKSPATTTTFVDATNEAATDGGGAPIMLGAESPTESDSVSDGGGPPQALLDTIAAAEAANLMAAMTPATSDLADGGVGPSEY